MDADPESLTGFDPFADKVIADPVPWYARMRREQPVFRVPGRGFYLVTRYEDVMTAVRDTDTFSNRFTSPGLALGQGSPAVQISPGWVGRSPSSSTVPFGTAIRTTTGVSPANSGMRRSIEIAVATRRSRGSSSMRGG